MTFYGPTCVVFLAFILSPLLRAEDWEFLYQVDGIIVQARKENGVQCYKAEGIIQSNLFELMAVVADLKRRPEWVRNLESSRAIEGNIESTVLLYDKYNFPWPASDRDTVTKSITKVDYVNLEIEADFFNFQHVDYPPQKGIVRIPYIKGHQFFKYQSESTTLSRNSICIHIGGDLPQWLVAMVSRNMPVDTLKDLQAQVEKTKNDYREFVSAHKSLAKKVAPK